ncbi:MAG: pilus assembly protein [Deltaproteobacteria bacterium]|nr:pilus assembly protein [Deltaproteobacteria bacterium]
MRRYRLNGRKDRGNTAVEFALTLPIFIILFIGIIEFGWYFFVQHTVQYATREGMRLALVGRTIADPSNPGNNLSREASIIQTIKNNAMLPVIRDGVLVSIYPLSTGYNDPNGWETQQDAGDPGEYMRVRSRYIHTFFTPLIGGFFGGGGITIQAEGTYRNELFN